MVEGSLDIKNLKVGDKVGDDEECVGLVHIAVIKRKGSSALTPSIEGSLSKDFGFIDFVGTIDKLKQRLDRMVPVVREHQNLHREVEEYLNKSGSSQRSPDAIQPVFCRPKVS